MSKDSLAIKATSVGSNTLESFGLRSLPSRLMSLQRSTKVITSFYGILCVKISADLCTTESDKEKADILQSYEKYKGDIWKIMESVPLIELGEIERVYNIIQTAIDADEVALLEKFGPIDQRKLAKKKKRAEKEAQEAEELREEIEARRKRKKTGATQTRKAIAGRKEDNASMDDLKPLIQERGRNRMDAMLQRLADKYTKKRQPTQSAKNKRKHAAKGEESGDNWHGNEPEPTLELSDADFDAFQQKLFSGKKDSNGESSAKNKKGSKRRKV